MKEIKFGIGFVLLCIYLWFVGEAFAHINVYLAFALIGFLVLGGVYLIRTKIFNKK